MHPIPRMLHVAMNISSFLFLRLISKPLLCSSVLVRVSFGIVPALTFGSQERHFPSPILFDKQKHSNVSTSSADGCLKRPNH
jgi:hypothetical protein